MSNATRSLSRRIALGLVLALSFCALSPALAGSDAIADWPILNALLNCSSGADLVAVHGLGGRGVSAGLTIIADGNPATAERLQRVLDGDPGIGVLRHADAGDAAAIEHAEHVGLSATLPGSL